MIISCPKCKVKFKVSAYKIPSQGRMVQCSKCSHKWKEHGAAEKSSIQGKIVFISIMLLISITIIFFAAVILFGNKIPMPNSLLLLLESIGIPINEGELFGRSFKR